MIGSSGISTHMRRARGASSGGSSWLTLCVYDLNGFKDYNDSFGHPAGDALLARFGSRLEAAAGDGRAYRLGGDEFCVLIEGESRAVDVRHGRVERVGREALDI